MEAKDNQVQTPAQSPSPDRTAAQMDDAFYTLVEDVLSLLGSPEGRECFLKNLERLSKWASIMPNSIQTSRPWTREEFAAAMAGPENLQDPRFGAYMDAFYEEYMENPEDKMQSFYENLFQDERELNRVDWLSVWETVRGSYEDWLKNEYEEDEFLKGEQA